MFASYRLVLAVGVLTMLPMAPAAIRAQEAPASTQGTADSLAFPRQFVNWVLMFQGDSAFAHAGPQLRESMKSAAGVNAMATRILTRFGTAEGTDAELQFAEGELKVYIAAMRFPQAPEPGAWVVAYSPSTKVVERAAFTSLANVKRRYPGAKLP